MRDAQLLGKAKVRFTVVWREAKVRCAQGGVRDLFCVLRGQASMAFMDMDIMAT